MTLLLRMKRFLAEAQPKVLLQVLILFRDIVDDMDSFGCSLFVVVLFTIDRKVFIFCKRKGNRNDSVLNVLG